MPVATIAPLLLLIKIALIQIENLLILSSTTRKTTGDGRRIGGGISFSTFQYNNNDTRQPLITDSLTH